MRSRARSAHTAGSGWIFQTDVSLLGLRLKIAQCLPHQLVEIDLRLLHFRSPDARERQQIVNQIPIRFADWEIVRQMPETFVPKATVRPLFAAVPRNP